MENYLNQLIADIAYATENLSWPYVKKESYDLSDWVSEEEEERMAPIRQLEDWTGIRKEMLPPQEMLSDEQVERLFKALNKLLDECNCLFVVQIEVPIRVQYATIRDYWEQSCKVKQQRMGFFEYCRPNTEHGKCAMGEKYCHCAFFKEMFKDMIDEDLTPEEERARELEIEVEHIKKKYGDEYMKYYPYHLDPEYDDENGNPHDYGPDSYRDGGEDEEDEGEDWWKKPKS